MDYQNIKQVNIVFKDGSKMGFVPKQLRDTGETILLPYSGYCAFFYKYGRWPIRISDRGRLVDENRAIQEQVVSIEYQEKEKPNTFFDFLRRKTNKSSV